MQRHDLYLSALNEKMNNLLNYFEIDNPVNEAMLTSNTTRSSSDRRKASRNSDVDALMMQDLHLGSVDDYEEGEHHLCVHPHRVP